MDFQWQQLLTHAVGFLVTLWILKRFAWGPLMAMMEERRNKIRTDFEEIEQERSKVSELEAEYQAKLRDIDDERRAKLIEAVEEGRKVAADIKQKAQQDVFGMNNKAKADIERDLAKAKVQLRDDMVHITVRAAEKLLRERLDDARQRDLIGRMIQDLEKA